MNIVDNLPFTFNFTNTNGMSESCIIRPEEPRDFRASEELVREAFWNVYRPGCLEHYVLHVLRNEPDFMPELSFVMEHEGKLIGFNIFVRATIKADDGKNVPILTMGPIAIHPDFRRKGLGKALLNYSLAKARQAGFGAVCFEGNIEFYRHCGFSYAADFGIRYHGLPPDADASFFLCKELQPGYLSQVSGEYATPDVYMVNEKEAEEFDSSFTPKTKLKLHGQIFLTNSEAAEHLENPVVKPHCKA